MSNGKIKEEKDVTKKTNRKEKYLYTCESITDSYEYKKSVKYFPNIYWSFVLQRTILNLIMTSLIAISFESLAITLVFLVAFQIFIMIVCKVRLEYFAEKNYEQWLKKGIVYAEIHTEFYDDYFIRQGDDLILKIPYSNIDRCIETDTNFYLEYKKRNTIIFIQKNTCELELINFIRKKFENIENQLGEEPKFNKEKKDKNSVFIKNFMIILLIITICSLWGAMWSFELVNQICPRHGFNVFKNAWVAWCWLPIPLLSIILGFKYKKTGNIVVGFIIGFYLSIMCIAPLIVPSSSKDYSQIDDYRDIIDVQLPSNGDLEIQEWGTYFDDDKTDYVIITAYYDNEDVGDFVDSIHNSSNWILSKEIKSELRLMIPRTFSSDDDAYYSIFNKTTNEYNLLPSEEGEYEVYAMKYDESDMTLEIHKFTYSYR